MNSLKKLQVMYICTQMLFAGLCFAGDQDQTTPGTNQNSIASESTPQSINPAATTESEELQQFSSIQEQINSWLESFCLVERFLNIEEKKKLIQLKSFYETQLSLLKKELNPNSLISFMDLISLFKSACLKIELLGCCGIPCLELQKIKLLALTKLSSILRTKLQNKKMLKYENKLALAIVWENVPTEFKQSMLKQILLWYTTKSRKISHLKALIFQDYYSENIILADKYLELTTKFNDLTLGNKALEYDALLSEISYLVQRLVQEAAESNKFSIIINEMIERLIAIREHIAGFCKNVEKFGLQIEKIRLLARFKVLQQSPKFKICRSDQRFTTTLDLFVGFMQQIFNNNSINQSDLIKLLEIKQEIHNLIELTGVGPIFGLLAKKPVTVTVLEDVHDIINQCCEVFLGKNIDSGGADLIKQLNNVIAGSSQAGGFFSQKLKTISELVINLALKTSPLWLKKIFPDGVAGLFGQTESAGKK